VATAALQLTLEARPAKGVPLWDLVLAVLDEHDVSGVEALDDRRWRVYFALATACDEAAAALARRFGRDGLRIERVEVPEEDWARRAQACLRAVRIGGLIVAPPWDRPADEGDALVIVITPSSGFGTGHHPSTRLCLHLLQQVDLRDRTVLDAGTGSGVLAIAAVRLGARHVLAVDRDPEAIAAARHNVALNGVAHCLSLQLADLRTEPLGPVDLVCANLTAAFFLRHAASLMRALRPGGWLVASGIETHDDEEVTRALAAFATLHGRAVEDGWVGYLWQRGPNAPEAAARGR
jgi:ribosomal protein L11 methyltransferase